MKPETIKLVMVLVASFLLLISFILVCIRKCPKPIKLNYSSGFADNLSIPVEHVEEVKYKAPEKYGCVTIYGVEVCLSTIISVVKTVYEQTAGAISYTSGGEFNLLPQQFVESDLVENSLFGDDTIRDVGRTVIVKLLRNSDEDGSPSIKFSMNFSWTTGIATAKSSTVEGEYDNVLYIMNGGFSIPEPDGPWFLSNSELVIKMIKSKEEWPSKTRTFVNKLTGKEGAYKVKLPYLKFEIHAYQDRYIKSRMWKFYLLVSADGETIVKTGDIEMDRVEMNTGLNVMTMCVQPRPTLKGAPSDPFTKRCVEYKDFTYV